jgi:hypothetical protein
VELVFKERGVVKVSIYGEVFSLRKPTMKDVEKLAGLSKGKDEVESQEVVKKFLNDLGLPFETLESMDFDHYLELVQGLTAPKKK